MICSNHDEKNCTTLDESKYLSADVDTVGRCGIDKFVVDTG
ncbi:MAG: hypothetical protein WCG98_10515 [bacterium]